MRKILAMFFMSLMVLFAIPMTSFAASPSVWYGAHVAGIGWMQSVHDGATAGTTGQSRQMEAVMVDVSGVSGGVTYRAHCADIGWTGWVTNQKVAGTTGQGKRMEAVEIKLTGSAASTYDIVYRVHAEGIGWMNWVKNGATAGTTGQGRRIEAMEVKLVRKSGSSGNGTSVSAALSWCDRQVGRTVGSGQCVALIKSYYELLGATAVSGNACDYTSNPLPNGWKRVQGGVPQPGDILVYTGAKYGHVAIYAGGNTSYHQNMSGKFVEKKTDWPYNKSWYSNTEKGQKYYWGYIRPKF